MTENKTRDILNQLLRDMDDFATMKNINYPPIYLLGGSGCIIANYIDRATTDIDILDMEYDASIGRLLRILEKYDFLDIYLTTIPMDFKDRVKRLKDYKNIYVLSKEDIILSKIGRYSESDIEDISLLIKNCDKELLLKLSEQVLNRSNISERVKNVFARNLKLFKEQFYV